jgi:hypothetical protein
MQLDRRSAASISTLSIQIRPIDAVMGAEVTGADLSSRLTTRLWERSKTRCIGHRSLGICRQLDDSGHGPWLQT